MDLFDEKTMQNLLRKYGFQFSKSLGQNFLMDREVIDRIADACQCEGETVLEIGPGIGSLTQALARRAKKVIAIEADASLIPILRETLADFENIEIIHADAMKVDLEDTLGPYKDGPVKVCANLPYYITTPIMTRLLESRLFHSVTSMV